MLNRRTTRCAFAIRVAAVCALLSGCAFNPNAAPGASHIGDERSVIDFAWDRDVPVVSVYVNDRGPYRFLFDTGAESTFISAHCASESGLELENADLRIGAAGFSSERSVQTSVVDELRLGSTRLLDVSAVVTPMDDGFDGVLGFPAFADLLLTLDGPNGRLVLEHGTLPSPHADPSCVALVRSKVALASPRVRGQVAGRPAVILVDSGFSGFLYLGAGAPEQLDMNFVADADGQTTALTEAGRRDITLGCLHERVEVGSLAFENVPTVVGMGVPVMLGGAFLRGVRATFDQRTQRVRFTR